MQSWNEIKKCYPNEHVAITNPQYPLNNLSQLNGGDVLDHDVELDDLLRRCNLSEYESYALLYTGDLGKAIGERGMLRVIEHD